MQDISSKSMLRHNDIFSDILNALLFEKPYIEADKLRDLMPETAYEDFDGNLRSMERDLIKEYGEGVGANYFAIAEFGIGNQTEIDATIPVRAMGYDYTAYKRQLDAYNNKKRELYRMLKTAKEFQNEELTNHIQQEIEQLGEFKLVPVVTIVLNFSRTRWNKAKSLKELVPAGYLKNGFDTTESGVDITEILKLMPDYRVKVFDVLHLNEETKSRFNSDFKDIVTVLSEGRIDKKHDFQKLKYPIEALDMIYAYTKDERYRKIRKKVVKKEMEGGAIGMSEFLDELERNKVIETVKKQYEQKHNDEYAISFIECGLNISEEEARLIFEAEILGAAIA